MPDYLFHTAGCLALKNQFITESQFSAYLSEGTREGD